MFSFFFRFPLSGPTSLPMGLKKDPPPPPPPRPYRTHARSSSLDLNRLGIIYNVHILLFKKYFWSSIDLLCICFHIYRCSSRQGHWFARSSTNGPTSDISKRSKLSYAEHPVLCFYLDSFNVFNSFKLRR